MSTDYRDLAEKLAQFINTKPLELHGVHSRGVPNEERIYLKANQRVALRNYLLLAGVLLPDNTAWPSPNHVMWLGADTLEVGTWLVVYTGLGSRMVSHI